MTVSIVQARGKKETLCMLKVTLYPDVLSFLTKAVKKQHAKPGSVSIQRGGIAQAPDEQEAISTLTSRYHHQRRWRHHSAHLRRS